MLKTLCRLTVLPLALASLCAAADPAVVALDSLQLNGWALLTTSGHIRLTHDSAQAGSAFVPTPFALGPNDSFSASFAYNSQPELDQCAADGLAFVAQNTAQGPGYLGEDGSGLGFFNGVVSPAVGVTFDYYANAITGTPANAAAIATPDGTDLVWTTPNPAALSGYEAYRYVWVAYDNPSKVMKVYYSATATRPTAPLLQTAFPVDLSTLFGGQVYFGVTAGTGSCYSHQALMYLSLDVVHQPSR